VVIPDAPYPPPICEVVGLFLYTSISYSNSLVEPYGCLSNAA
jgi:hypothetical protein